MQKDIARQADMMRSFEEPPEALLSGRQPYFADLQISSGSPVSPRQAPQDDARRGLLTAPRPPNFFRPPVPTHISLGPRQRFGSVGTANSSPNSVRSNCPPNAPPPQHPLASVEPPPNMGRRHTS